MRLAKAGLSHLFLESLDADDLARLQFDWPVWAGASQRPPAHDWRIWLLLGGRGAGKTRAGAQWISAIASGNAHFAGESGGRLALVGETYGDVRAVMVEGESGVLAVHDRRDRPAWNPSLRRLTWDNGVIGQLYSSNDPEGLRGAQFGAAWCDELGKWQHPDDTWNMLQFCLRLGRDPRVLATTTPKPLRLLRRLLQDPAVAVSRSPTSDNRHNLAPGFLTALEHQFGGTRLGRQELDAEIIEDRDDALWRRDLLEASRAERFPQMRRILVAVDPPASSGATSNACGIVAAGLAEDGKCYVLADRTIAAASPSAWSAAAVRLFHSLSADAIVAETNHGGEMVRTMIAMTDPTVPVRDVRAHRGKWLRAEPVALLYERGLVRHAGRFAELEDQMCAFGFDGLADGVSPDRVDALVWAVSELMLRRGAQPRIRTA